VEKSEKKIQKKSGDGRGSSVIAVGKKGFKNREKKYSGRDEKNMSRRKGSNSFRAQEQRKK